MQLLSVIPYPRYIENSYQKKLTVFVKKITKIVKGYVLEFLNKSTEYKKLIRNDDFDADFSELLNSLNIKIAFTVTYYLDSIQNISKKLDLFNFRAVKNSVNRVGIKSVPKATNFTKDIRKLWITENVGLIKSIPRNLIENVERVVFDSINLGHSSKTLSQNLQTQFQISKNRAKLIARDQIAKLNGNLTRQRNLDLGITKYIWSTAKDGDRVRTSHQVLEGKYCDWNDVEIYRNSIDGKEKKRTSKGAALYHPGQDIQCRCTSIAVIDEVA